MGLDLHPSMAFVLSGIIYATSTSVCENVESVVVGNINDKQPSLPKSLCECNIKNLARTIENNRTRAKKRLLELLASASASSTVLCYSVIVFVCPFLFFSLNSIIHFFGSSSDSSPKKRREQCVLDDGLIQLQLFRYRVHHPLVFSLFRGCVHVVCLIVVPSYLWPYGS